MEEELGLSFSAGEEHYRAYVGPPADYDLVSAMVFNLLTSVGLRQHHKLLDIGCGSLRLGRLFIPYLNQTNYIGVEPNSWLVEKGIQHEVGNTLINIKKPEFIFADSLESVTKALNANFVVAQSIFSHCGVDLIKGWLEDIHKNTSEESISLVTFIKGENSFTGSGWVYPGCVEYSESVFSDICESHGFRFVPLNWYHPRQTWVALIKGKKKYYFEDSDVSWNNLNL